MALVTNMMVMSLMKMMKTTRMVKMIIRLKLSKSVSKSLEPQTTTMTAMRKEDNEGRTSCG